MRPFRNEKCEIHRRTWSRIPSYEVLSGPTLLVFSIACNHCFHFCEVAVFSLLFDQTLAARVSAENHATSQAIFRDALRTSLMFPFSAARSGSELRRNVPPAAYLLCVSLSPFQCIFSIAEPQRMVPDEPAKPGFGPSCARQRLRAENAARAARAFAALLFPRVSCASSLLRRWTRSKASARNECEESRCRISSEV